MDKNKKIKVAIAMSGGGLLQSRMYIEMARLLERIGWQAVPS